MHLTEITYPEALPIEGYGPGFFRVSGAVIRGGVLVVGETAISWGGLDDQAPLLALAGQVDVLFLGTGANPAYALRDLVAALSALRRLPEADQEVVQMCLIAGLTPAQAATALGEPPSTVRSRLSRARRRLALGAIDLLTCEELT